jgi:lipopolysaccharide export system protein LptA
VVLGNKGNRDGKTLLTKIQGQTLTRRLSNSDTLWIAADTLLVFQKTEKITTDSTKKDSLKVNTTSPSVKGKPYDGVPAKKSARVTIKEELNARIDSLKTPLIPLDSIKLDSAQITPKPKSVVVAGTKTDTVSNKPPDKKDIEKIIAYGSVKVVRADFQSVSDSLMYNMVDSTINFYKKPVIWNNANQLEADTVTILLKNNKLNQMRLIQNSFVIETDTIGNFNQIKGRTLDAFFDKQNELKTIKVEGNGESLYFALDEKNRIIGLNKVQCSSMQFYFAEKKIRQIVFRGQPESYLMPPKEIFSEDMKLEKFEWKKDLRPSKKKIVSADQELSINKTSLVR